MIPPAPPHPSAPSDTSAGFTHRRILVMDDEELIRELLRELLSTFGHDVASASEGAEAVRLYEAAARAGKPFDLVIVDLSVPAGGMNGLDTIRALRAVDPRVRAIVASGYLQNPVLTNYREHGFVGMVTKPYSVSELLREVQRSIESRA